MLIITYKNEIDLILKVMSKQWFYRMPVLNLVSRNGLKDTHAIGVIAHSMIPAVKD